MQHLFQDGTLIWHNIHRSCRCIFLIYFFSFQMFFLLLHNKVVQKANNFPSLQFTTFCISPTFHKKMYEIISSNVLYFRYFIHASSSEHQNFLFLVILINFSSFTSYFVSCVSYIISSDILYFIQRIVGKSKHMSRV